MENTTWKKSGPEGGSTTAVAQEMLDEIKCNLNKIKIAGKKSPPKTMDDDNNRHAEKKKRNKWLDNLF